MEKFNPEKPPKIETSEHPEPMPADPENLRPTEEMISINTIDAKKKGGDVVARALEEINRPLA